MRLRQLRTFEDLGGDSSTHQNSCHLPPPPHAITTLLFFFSLCPLTPTPPHLVSNSKQWIDPGSLLTPVSCPTTKRVLTGKKQNSTQTSLYPVEQLTGLNGWERTLFDQQVLASGQEFTSTSARQSQRPVGSPAIFFPPFSPPFFPLL